VLAKKLTGYVRNGTGKEDLNTVELIDRLLGKQLRVQKPPMAYTSLRATVKTALKALRAEKEAALRAMTPGAVLKLARTLQEQQAKRPAEWGLTLDYIARQLREPAAFDVLLTALEKAATVEQRRTAHAALVRWAGVDQGPTSFDSPGESSAAVARWKQWRQRTSR
jgi:hypothetical protein